MYTPALLFLVVGLIAAGSAQYDSPLPPRALAIPGALPAGGRGRGGPVPAPGAARRLPGRGRAGPGLRGRAQPPPLPPRPVVEQEDDGPAPTTYPPPTYQPTTFQPPPFRPNPAAVQDLPAPLKQQFRGPPEEAVFARGPRPSPLPLEETGYTRDDEDTAEEQVTTRPRPAYQEEQSFTRARPAPQEEQSFNRARPAPQEEVAYQRPSRPAIQQPEEQPSYQRSRPSQQEYLRPRPQISEKQNLVSGRGDAKPSAYNRAQLQARPQKPQPQPQAQPITSRQRKPTAQVIKKYRDDNPDGSITWGFENDDGTFKEETIGTDCITRGKYGYIDPDGVRREYTYSSGIPCDKANQDSAVGATNEGYIDYTNNKYVYPNGQEINIENMVKNRARRPVYRN